MGRKRKDKEKEGGEKEGKKMRMKKKKQQKQNDDHVSRIKNNLFKFVVFWKKGRVGCWGDG